MVTDQEIESLAETGIKSVFDYINRTAEVTDDGIRWKTLSFQNEPQYGADLYNGVAGISLFLSDYYNQVEEPKVRDLALGALSWCSIPGQPLRHDFLDFSNDCLATGRAGIGLSWLRYGLATGEAMGLEKASEIAEKLLTIEIGPTTRLLFGAAGEGIFLYRLWETTRDPQHLSGAARYGYWLGEVAIRDNLGCYWPAKITNSRANRLGLGTGTAGIGYFFLLLYEATEDQKWLSLVRDIAVTLSKQARADHGGLNWAWDIADEELTRCQWCGGAPGVGLFFTKAYEVLSDPTFLDISKAAGETTYAHGNVRSNPSQCHGLVGSADLFVELYQITKEPLWLERIHAFSNMILAYKKTTPEGDIWQADEPGHYSPDFMCGAAGIGHFFYVSIRPVNYACPFFESE